MVALIDTCPVPVFGDTSYRGHCPIESVEQQEFFRHLRRNYPDTLGLIAIHPRNEGLRVGGQLGAMRRYRAEGMTKGAADIIIPAKIPFVCELKRRDPTKGSWQDGQREYLQAAKDAGAYACMALGAEAALSALALWELL